MKHIILDTDIFGDPDDFFALIYALSRPEIIIDLIVTADEKGTSRATYLQHVLSLCRKNVPIVAGKDIGYAKYLLVPKDQFAEKINTNFLEKIHEIINKNLNTFYVCIAPQSNLAAYLNLHPEMTSKITTIAMGSSLEPIFGRIEHNVRVDIPAVQKVNSLVEISWVLADHTINPATKISPTVEWYKQLSEIKTPLAHAIVKNITEFWQKFYPESYLHDPLAVSAVFADFISFRPARVKFTNDGRMVVGSGKEMKLSKSVEYKDFMDDFVKSVLLFVRAN